ncbi:MAG: TOBE domain-containing protein [Methanosarcinaceae archaeon]|nr:TOBE domain-containing protein [Methanosarcinaceae archaeon]MDF1533556.1 TOBE domain-containing protein [Methanosarcinaceae archaeon]
MKTKTETKLWLTEDGKQLIGEGTAALLEAINKERSLNKASKRLNISYKHAWKMLKSMQEGAGSDVVTTIRGGKDQGTFLTDHGRELLAEYESQKNIIHETVDDETFWEGVGLKITARNRMRGMVVEVEKGDVISKVKILIEPTVVTSVITSDAVDKLRIKEGDEVFAIVKSTEVMIGKK